MVIVSRKCVQVLIGALIGLCLPLVAMAQTATVLTSAQIVEIFAGKTIKQVDDQYWAFFEPTGRLGGLYVNDEDEGRWGFAEDQICQQWREWNANKTLCFYVLEGIEGAYRFDNGEGSGFNVVVRDGNPMDLL